MSTDLQDYQLTRDRQRRQIIPSRRFGEADIVHLALNVAEKVEYSDPKTYVEALSSPEREQWIQAMPEEYESLIRNNIWILVEKPVSAKPIGRKWIFKKKLEVTAESQTTRFKARLVAKGFSQKEGIDYHEVFAPVVKQCSIRILLSLVNQFDLELHQFGVKTAFLNGELDEEILMNQPESFTDRCVS